MRLRLLTRLQRRRYEAQTHVHVLGPLRLAFTRIADPDAVLDQIVEAEDRREKLTGERRDGNDLHLPYWAELWDSAIGIGTYLAEQKDLRLAVSDAPLVGGRRRRPPGQNPKSVLDLGCGMGFAGMVAAAMGARVMLADLEPDALLLARLNTLPWAGQVRTRRLNWQRDRLDERFDLIIGADVLYDRTQWEYLEPFFRAHLCRGGTVLLGEPGRQTGDLFPDWIAARGWEIDRFQQPVSTREAPIRIFRLSNPPASSPPASCVHPKK